MIDKSKIVSSDLCSKKMWIMVTMFVYMNQNRFNFGKNMPTDKEGYLDKCMYEIKGQIPVIQEFRRNFKPGIRSYRKINNIFSNFQSGKSNGLGKDFLCLFLQWSMEQQTNFNDYFIKLFMPELRKIMSCILDILQNNLDGSESVLQYRPFYETDSFINNTV